MDGTETPQLSIAGSLRLGTSSCRMDGSTLCKARFDIALSVETGAEILIS